jgi:hypothetical protein
MLLPMIFAMPLAARAARHEHARAKPATPKALGRFDDWVAATHLEAGHTTCYAFTYAKRGGPQPGKADIKERPVLTVTERPAIRDAVAISAGYTYPPNAAVQVQVDHARFDFYTAQHSAFARDGAAAVAAFRSGQQAVAKGPGPHHDDTTHDFSLRGFRAAYAAITRTCPAK